MLLFMYGFASYFDMGLVCFKNLWITGLSFGTISHNFFPDFCASISVGNGGLCLLRSAV